jgi:hypothetical protein
LRVSFTSDVPSSSAFRSQNLPGPIKKYRNPILNYIPQDIFVQTKIFVGYDVAQASDLISFYIGIACSHLGRNALRCFSDDLQIAYNGIEGLFVLHKLVQVQPLGIAHDLFAGFANVIQVQSRVT